MKPLLAIIALSSILATLLVTCNFKRPIASVPTSIHSNKVVIKNSNNVNVILSDNDSLIIDSL